jgi:outer membrane protein TolC
MCKQILPIFIVLLLSCAFATAQSPAEEALLDADIQWLLPPLDSLQELALRNSASVKFQHALIRKGEAQVAFAKKLWQNNIMANFNVATGNQNLLMLNSSSDLQSTSITNGYRAGLNINIPLYEFSGRNTRIQLHREELDAAIYKKDESEMLLSRQVNQEYFQLIAAQRILKIRADAVESAQLSLMMAEQQFQQGLIPITEWSRVKEITAKAETEYAMAYATFFTYFHQFEDLIGIPLKELILKK